MNILSFFMLVLYCVNKLARQDKRKNKYLLNKPQKKSIKDDYINKITRKCKRCGLFGDIQSLTNNILATAPAKYKMGASIIKKYYPGALQEKNNVLYGMNNTNLTDEMSQNQNLIDNVCILLPDISMEMLWQAETIVLSRVNKSSFNLSKDLIRAIFCVEDIFTVEQKIISTKCENIFYLYFIKIIKHINMIVDLKNNQFEIEITTLVQKLSICWKEFVHDIIVTIEKVITEEKITSYKCILELLESISENIREVLEQFDSRNELKSIFTNSQNNKIYSLYNAEDNIIKPIMHKFYVFVNSIWPIIKYLFILIKPKNNEDSSEELIDFFKSEVKHIELKIIEILQDEIDVIKDKLDSVYEDIVDDINKNAKETISEIIESIDAYQDKLIETKTEQISKKELEKISKIINNH
ncbi:hypothetical protein COBT_001075 [Conglomerata obtusa]